MMRLARPPSVELLAGAESWLNKQFTGMNTELFSPVLSVFADQVDSLARTLPTGKCFSRQIIVPKLKLGAPVGFLMAQCTKSDQVLDSVIAPSASRLNVMDLEILHTPAPLATPAVPFQDLAPEFAVVRRIKPQAWLVLTWTGQNVPFTGSKSCIFSDFGRPATTRVREALQHLG